MKVNKGDVGPGIDQRVAEALRRGEDVIWSKELEVPFQAGVLFCAKYGLSFHEKRENGEVIWSQGHQVTELA